MFQIVVLYWRYEILKNLLLPCVRIAHILDYTKIKIGQQLALQ